MFVYLLSWAELGWAGLGWAGLGWTWSSGREAGGGWGRLDGEVRVRYSISGVHSTGQPSPSLVVAPVITIHCPATGLIGHRRCYVILFWAATTLRGIRRLCKNEVIIRSVFALAIVDSHSYGYLQKMPSHSC